MSGKTYGEIKYIAGVDEAGRGPLAGPVVAAAVILNPHKRIPGLTDSKLITEKQREKLYDQITADSFAYSVAYATVSEIDALNILQATLLAMRRAVSNLSIAPVAIWVDGNQDPRSVVPAKMIIEGDKLIPAISAASIIAKVVRDRMMKELDLMCNGYGFAKHKGYGTKAHLLALREMGPSIHHRRSFSPVKEMMQKGPVLQALND